MIRVHLTSDKYLTHNFNGDMHSVSDHKLNTINVGSFPVTYKIYIHLLIAEGFHKSVHYNSLFLFSRTVYIRYFWKIAEMTIKKT
jgi:hypothetical protein